MRLHANARTCPRSRRLLVARVEEGWSAGAAAVAAGVSKRTAYKWIARWRVEGSEGLLDRSSRPLRSPTRIGPDRVAAVVALRRLRMTASEIAEIMAMPLSTVSLVLKRVGLGKRSRLEPLEPANRYERKRPGELIHIDVKKLGRIARPGHRAFGRSSQAGWQRRQYRSGWEYLHVCVDDATRLAYAEVLTDERGETAAGFLERATSWYCMHGITVERVMTDNGACYRSRAHAETCRRLAIRHLTTRPYRPRTNGKAERFIQTTINGWAYNRVYGSSSERTDLLPSWLHHYNWNRPHGSLKHKPPGTRLSELNNVPSNYT
jgi:transposase InsO family protein